MRPHHFTVIGAGPVGLANAILLARRYEVVVLDSDPACVAQLHKRQSPVPEAALQHALENDALNLRATLDKADAYAGASHVVVCVPTPADAANGGITTTTLEAVIADARAHAPAARIVIRSTVPIGFTQRMRARHGFGGILHAPEFLREGHALHDAAHPSRIVVGGESSAAFEWADLMLQATGQRDAPVLVMGDREAEAVKLMANTLLVARVALFNELDTLAAHQGLCAEDVLRGVCLDPRIGEHYNHPSFGFGGPCLPRDATQLAQTGGRDFTRATAVHRGSNAARAGTSCRRSCSGSPAWWGSIGWV